MERPTYRAQVVRVFDHCEDTRSLFLRTISAPLPHYVPGMFISVTIPLAEETRIRPYTIASSPEDGEPFEVCFNLIPNGPGAKWMYERNPGDVLDFTGPFGAFTLERPPEHETVFIAEGTAIAPIRPMIRRALADARYPIHLLYAARQPQRLLYRAELEEMVAAHPHFSFEPRIIAGEREIVYARLLDEAQHRWVSSDDDRSRHFYVCGVGPGVLKLRDLLRKAGYERRAVRYEQW